MKIPMTFPSPPRSVHMTLHPGDSHPGSLRVLSS